MQALRLLCVTSSKPEVASILWCSLTDKKAELTQASNREAAHGSAFVGHSSTHSSVSTWAGNGVSPMEHGKMVRIGVPLD